MVFNDHESVAASSSGPSPLSLSHSLLTTPTSSRLQRTPFACPTLTRRPDPPFPGWIPASGSFPSPQCWSPEPYVPLTCEFHVGELPKCSECVSGLLVCQVHLVTCKGRSAGICPQCQRVLCTTHLDCFCSESELWREEEKGRRNPKTSAPGSSRASPSFPSLLSRFTPVSSCSRASSFSFLQDRVRVSSLSSRSSPFLKQADVFWRQLAATKGEQPLNPGCSSVPVSSVHSTGDSTANIYDRGAVSSFLLLPFLSRV